MKNLHLENEEMKIKKNHVLKEVKKEEDKQNEDVIVDLLVDIKYDLSSLPLLFLPKPKDLCFSFSIKKHCILLLLA